MINRRSDMNRKLLFINGIVALITLILLGYYNKTNSKVSVISNVNEKDNIYIMYTDKDYKSHYNRYNILNKFTEEIFTRKNYNYSDFNVDEINNIMYYSEFVNNKHDIYKVDLSDRNKKVTRLLGSKYSGDMFELNNDKIIFRTFSKDRRGYTLGVYSLKDNKVELWNNEDNDVYIFNFYWDKYIRAVYTVERSLKDMETALIPTHKIFKYDENGENKQMLYSTDKSINNISVNYQVNKIIFDASTIENDNLINKIYLLDLNNNVEKILIEPDNKFDSISISTAKAPEFSSKGDGFYFLATTPKSKIIQEVKGSTPIMSNSIYYYDLDSKKVSRIFEAGKFVINSFKLN